MYFHFYGVSHRHLIFENSSQKWLAMILFLLVTNHTWCVGFEKICKDFIE